MSAQPITAPPEASPKTLACPCCRSGLLVLVCSRDPAHRQVVDAGAHFNGMPVLDWFASRGELCSACYAASKRQAAAQPWVIVHADGPDTEQEAATVARRSARDVARRVMGHLISCGGDHDSRGAETLGMWLNSYAPARNALMRKGYVADVGDRATNKRGRTVIVWRPTAAGRAAYQQGEL